MLWKKGSPSVFQRRVITYSNFRSHLLKKSPIGLMELYVPNMKYIDALASSFLKRNLKDKEIG